jgi:hypothetical protein
MTFSGIIMETEESKRQDMTLRHSASRSVGLEPKVAQVPRDCVPASDRVAAASQINPGAGTSREGRWRAARLNLKIDDFQAGRRILGLRRTRVDFGEI